MKLSRAALDLLETALHHSDPERFARAYRLLWRAAEAPLRWDDRADPDLRRLNEQDKAVRRDIHKMHAFVRFREVGTGPRRAFAAWFEPEHPIVEAAAPFFARRFGDMDWVIATPHLTARFLEGRLDYAETEAGFRPPEDATEDLWRTYYASIFNPARLMVQAMQAEMPKKYWHNLPEARLIPQLVRQAPERARAMQAAAPGIAPAHAAALARRAAPPAPPDEGLPALAAALDACRRCPIGATATQAVPGEGPAPAALMLVGEQPGDQEDRSGRPFVGPAGQVLDRALEEAGIDRKVVYLTNAVKHFKFAPRGKRRLHQRPDAGEVQHCRWWLQQELQLVRPRLVVALGATALSALTGSGEGLLKRRGRIEQGEPAVLPTIHPSYLLRLPSGAEEERVRFVADLRAAAAWLAAAPAVTG